MRSKGAAQAHLYALHAARAEPPPSLRAHQPVPGLRVAGWGGFHTEGDIRTARTAWCTARAPRLRFYQPFPAFFTFFQGGKDAVA